MRVSLTKVNTFLECEQQYWYRYIEKLEPINRRPEPILGRVMHSYMENYYRQFQADEIPTADDAAARAWKLTHDAYLQEVTAYKQASWLAGDIADAERWSGLLNEARRLAVNYHRYRGRMDARRWDILLVEEPVEIELPDGNISSGVADLVVRNRDTGRVGLVEHKTAKTIPDSGVRLRDLQTVKYSRILELTHGIKVDEVIWNYLRTKVPEHPSMLKNGRGLSRAQIDTTRREYLQAIKDAGLRWTDYRDMLSKLAPKARESFFPRYELVVVADVDELLNNYMRGVEQLASRVQDWREGDSPIRHLSRSCQFCAYSSLCDAALVTGDESDVIRLKYTRRGNAETTD